MYAFPWKRSSRCSWYQKPWNYHHRTVDVLGFPCIISLSWESAKKMAGTWVESRFAAEGYWRSIGREKTSGRSREMFLDWMKKKTRTQSCRKETARCRSCSFWVKVRRQHSLYKFKSSQASKARLQSSKHTAAKQNLMQNGHSRSRVLELVERR